MNPNRLLKFVFLFLSFFIFCQGFSQYADKGDGMLKNKIWWLNWNGFSLIEGASKTFTTDDGLIVTVKYSNVSGPALLPTEMNTWYGAVLHLLYDFTDPAMKPALYHPHYETEPTRFRLTLSAKRNGVSVPITFVTADAEASAVTEITTLTTNGSNWKMIDFFRNSSQTNSPLSGCNTQTVNISDTYGGVPETGQNPVMSTESPGNGSLVVDVVLDHSNIIGQMALAFGVLDAVDRGDLPSSYGNAMHRLSFEYSNECNVQPPYPVVTQTTNLTLGIVPGDADGLQIQDDNVDGVDEDALGAFPTYSKSGTYDLAVPLTNTTGTNTYLGAWFDFNANGTFEANELSYVTVPPNAHSANVSWSGVPAALSKSKKYSFRFRLSSDLTAVQKATGYAKDGEVEDYQVFIPQTIITTFATPDTVCVNEPVTITNKSVGASTFYWNFCVANASTNPEGVNLGNFGFNTPVFSDYTKDDNNYYVFVTNNFPGKLVRLDFGNSLLNTPSAHDFGNLGGVIPDFCEGIQLVKNEGKWYAIVLGDKPVGRIVKVEFGASLSNNAPLATNWGNIGDLQYPTDLHLFQNGNEWYGLTINAISSTITRFNFSSSFSNTPTAVNLGNIGGLNYPSGIYAIASNNNWYAFVSNAGNGGSSSTNASISRLDFGNSLLNTPVGVNLGNPNNKLSSARDLTIYQSCNEIFGFIVNYSTTNDIVRLNFNNSLTSTPSAGSIGNIGNLNFPHSISKLFRVENDLYSFITNVNNNTITRLKFSGCNSASIASSTSQNPDPITYNTPGTYNINLTTDDGLPTQGAFCKQVVVLSKLHTPLQRKTVCKGDSVLLKSSAVNGNQWSTGSTANTVYVKSSGVYWVQSVNANGCVNVDSFRVSVKDLPSVNLGADTTICEGSSLVLNAGNAGATYAWQDGQTTQTVIANRPGLYSVVVTKNGCRTTDSVNLTTLSLPVVSIRGNNTICEDGTTTLEATGGTLYSWSPASGLSNPLAASTAASPATTTEYEVLVTGQNGCKAKDSIIVTVTPKPVFTASASKSVLCKGDTATLTATGGDVYTWSPAVSLSSPNNGTTLAYPAITTQYEVMIEENRCQVKDTLLVNLPVATKPNVVTTKSNDINCFIGEATLHTGGGSQYLWTPANGLSDPTSNNPVVRVNATTTYHLFVTTTDGCLVEDSITVYVLKGDNGSGFPVPNAFTPNGDGKNDCFEVKYWGDVTDFSLNIYNRWGELLFHADNPTQCWNGVYKGQRQPDDVYVYWIKAKTRCGNVFRKGSFALIR